MRALLFPDPPRAFPGRRLVKILLRGAHVVCAAFCLGAYAFALPDRLPWLVAAIVSGSLIVLLDLHESAAFLLEVRGMVVLGKVVALAFLPACGVWLLAAVVFVSVVSSHAPSSVRHRLLFGRVRVARTRG